MGRRFVIISGLPGSGKTTLARRLAPALDLPLIDKDEILERLFESRGIGDANWRRALSRESDVMFQRAAIASNGAVLTSFWRQRGMSPDSGTPTNWLSELSTLVVDVRCVCSPHIAARRFIDRVRHDGHLDTETTYDSLVAKLESQMNLPPLDVGPRIDVDTSAEPRIAELVIEIQRALETMPISTRRSSSSR